MKLRVRPERSADTAAVRALLLAAFPTPAEAELVERLHSDGAAEVALVAEDAGRVVGHVLLSRMKVEDDTGRSWRSLALAPIAVEAACRRQGIGTTLARTALFRASQRGEALVFVLGEPAWYARLGFRADAALPFRSPYAGPFFMAATLSETPLPRAGRAGHAAAFASLG